MIKRQILLALCGVAFSVMTLAQQQGKEITDLPRGASVPEVEKAVDAFFTATKTQPVAPDSIALHSIMIVKHGKVVLERWYNGHTAYMPHAMYSVSKTFTAIAIGMCVDEGRLSVTDRVISFFPDKLPKKVSKNLAAMTVRDLLTMTCGQHDEPTSTEPLTKDWVKEFLAFPVPHKPGTYFWYNSIGSYMLSAIVQKVTGEKMVDYLNSRLFEPLHIKYPVWEESPQGINCGGWGLSITTEDMAKVGQLFLQLGQWNGRQLVSSAWLKEMSSYQVASAPAGTRLEDAAKVGLSEDNNDWMHGYGYQMWVCRDNGYRADGFAGQYFMVFPERDAVLVLTTSSSVYQPYMDLIWKHLIPVL